MPYPDGVAYCVARSPVRSPVPVVPAVHTRKVYVQHMQDGVTNEHDKIVRVPYESVGGDLPVRSSSRLRL